MMTNDDEQKSDLLSSGILEVDEETGTHLKEAGKWGKTLAFISIAIMVLVVVFFVMFGRLFSLGFGILEGAEAAGFLFGIAIVAGLLVLFLISLFRFSRGMQDGIENQDSEAFERGLSGLKIYFIFIVIISALLALSSIMKLVN